MEWNGMNERENSEFDDEIVSDEWTSKRISFLFFDKEQNHRHVSVIPLSPGFLYRPLIHDHYL